MTNQKSFCSNNRLPFIYDLRFYLRPILSYHHPTFYISAIIIGGYKQTSEGLKELWNDRTLNVDLLMALAAIGACLIGNYFEGAMLTFIFCLSGALEEYTTNKSQKKLLL